MAEFFHMGGYAFHVWTTWGASVLAIGWLILARRARLARAQRALEDDEANDDM
ncbi:MAG: heme exporter protein CcmD [Pseudomonadota bacterium]